MRRGFHLAPVVVFDVKGSLRSKGGNNDPDVNRKVQGDQLHLHFTI